MNFVKISDTQIVNLDLVTRVEIYMTQDIRYTTVFFTGGESYRLTEDESELLIRFLKPRLEGSGDKP